MTQSSFENEHTTMRIENGIWIVEYTPNLHITLEMAKENVKIRLELSQGKTYPMFCDTRNIAKTDKYARDYLSKHDAVKGLSAGAFLVGNWLHKFAFNVFLSISKPTVPAKLFTDKQEALKWLEQFRLSKLN